jgi:hypothetical protein
MGYNLMGVFYFVGVIPPPPILCNATISRVLALSIPFYFSNYLALN